MNRLTLVLILCTCALSSLGSHNQSTKDLLRNLGNAATKAASGYVEKQISREPNSRRKKDLNEERKIISTTSNLDHELKLLSDDLAAKVFRKNKVRLALADFGRSSDKNDPSFIYIREQIEMNLINADNLQVMDRKHIQALLDEHNLDDEGYISERTAKSAIAFIKVDGWVLGEITKFGDQVKIQLKVIDVSTSQIYAVSTSNLIDMSELRKCNECNGTGVLHSKTTCITCKGSGGETCYSCGGVGNPYNGLTGKKQACETCAGKGKIGCNVCRGTGQMTASHTCSKCQGSGKKS